MRESKEKLRRKLDKDIAIIIPSYEPSEFLLYLCGFLQEKAFEVIVVDDGSGEEYKGLFNRIEASGCVVLCHESNLGKGRALKDAFRWVLENRPEVFGVVTADSDGQH